MELINEARIHGRLINGKFVDAEGNEVPLKTSNIGSQSSQSANNSGEGHESDNSLANSNYNKNDGQEGENKSSEEQAKDLIDKLNKAADSLGSNKPGGKNKQTPGAGQGDSKDNRADDLNKSGSKGIEDDIAKGIDDFNKQISIWKEKKEIKLKEIINIYNYILSFENKYLSDCKKRK